MTVVRTDVADVADAPRPPLLVLPESRAGEAGVPAAPNELAPAARQGPLAPDGDRSHIEDMSEPGSRNGLDVRVLRTAEAATELALGEVRSVLREKARPFLSFATGGTFTAMLQWLHGEVVAGRLIIDRAVATHLDEYVGFAPERAGSMVHELCTACPCLWTLLRRGAFLPVPHDGDAESLRRHEERLRQMGPVDLQFLGIGRNGHVAFHEPGVDLARGFHFAELSAATRDDARARFHPAPVPDRAATSGVATILGARRLVLCAFGRAKAPAVRAMLEGDIGPACPASAIRRHGNALVLLDREAASGIARTATASF